MTVTESPTCWECGTDIARVTQVIDPQAVALDHRAQCGHRVPPALARALWLHHGYRWDILTVTGTRLIGSERERHHTQEGFTPAHDAAHDPTDLPWAAWAYIDAAVHRGVEGEPVDPPTVWPWDDVEWKRDASALRRLVIAGSLIAAEIDRRLAEQIPTIEESHEPPPH